VGRRDIGTGEHKGHRKLIARVVNLSVEGLIAPNFSLLEIRVGGGKALLALLEVSTTRFNPREDPASIDTGRLAPPDKRSLPYVLAFD
jgi:hypothetical protein